jgi:hypothetical protein
VEILGDIQELEPDNDVATDVILEVLGLPPDVDSDDGEEEEEEEDLGEEVESESDDAPRKRKTRKKDERECGEREESDDDLPKRDRKKTSPKKKQTQIHIRKGLLEEADDREDTVKTQGKRKAQSETPDCPQRISQGVGLLRGALDLDGVSEEEDIHGSPQPKRKRGQRKKSVFEEDG